MKSAKTRVCCARIVHQGEMQTVLREERILWKRASGKHTLQLKIEKMGYRTMSIHYEVFEIQGKQVVLRSPEPEDAQAMIDLVNALDTQTVFLAREPGEFTMALEKEETFLLEQKEAENSLFLICLVDGVVMGSCQASSAPRKRFSHKASIGIALKQEVCGLGIGRKMMNTLITWGKARGFSHMELQVDSGNLPALKLYLSLGFVVDGCKYRERMLADGTYRDDYIMHLPLNQ